MPEFVQPIILTLPVQLLAYYVAVFKGTDVDQPRNLAKSVTVEGEVFLYNSFFINSLKSNINESFVCSVR